MKYFFLLAAPIIVITLNYFLKKFSLLLSYTGERHQRFVEQDTVPMSGGLILLISFLFYFNNFINHLQIYFVLIFLIGFFSDIKLMSSPIKRFILQVLLVSIFIFSQDIQIVYTRFIILDQFLEYKFFSYIFVAFCMMILINGTNFIDGLNTLVLGYYLIISAAIIKSGIISELNIATEDFFYWVIILLLLYIFNLFKKIFIGDGGSYLLGFIYSFLLILAYTANQEISPFFIVLLLWYPCFENLFSIVRKYRLNKSPINPDAKHFHQLLFFYIKSKYLLKNTLSNSMSANIINLYNALIFFIGTQNITNTQLQISLLLGSVFLYIYLYLKLFIYRYKKKPSTKY
tara:strand:+ start:4078 stop:5112 length:1035 start_codon:yes stop_codon:yes gene_type:complete